MIEKTLSKRVTEFSLDADDAFVSSFPQRFGRLVIQADLVHINGRIQWPSCAISIHCRKIVAEGNAVLDVSGAPATPRFDPDESFPNLNGTPDQPDGKAGANGGDGNHGGTVEIFCNQIEGDLAIRANGSNGGNGQRGGDGVKPKRPDGVNGAFKPSKGDPKCSPYGGGVLQGRGLKWYVSWASGQPGGNARNGGNAGPSGAGGKGGNGGRIDIRIASNTGVSAAQEAKEGEAGLPGSLSLPGPAGDAGIGGRNAICHIHVNVLFKDIKVVDFVKGKNKDANDYAKKYNISERAASGKGGASKGADALPPETSVSGSPGQLVQKDALDADAEKQFDADFLDLLLSRAQRYEYSEDIQSAKIRLIWIMKVSEIRSSSDTRIASIRETAAERLKKIDERSKDASGV